MVPGLAHSLRPIASGTVRFRNLLCVHQDATADTPRMGDSRNGGASFTSTPPPNPAADKIAQRTALIPRNFPGSIDVSALQVTISPRAPGPSNRPSGWRIGCKPWRAFCRALILASVIPFFTCFLFLMRTLSTFDRMIWWEMPYSRSNVRMLWSVLFMPCELSMRTNTRRSLGEVNIKISFCSFPSNSYSVLGLTYCFLPQRYFIISFPHSALLAAP